MTENIETKVSISKSLLEGAMPNEASILIRAAKPIEFVIECIDSGDVDNPGSVMINIRKESIGYRNRRQLNIGDTLHFVHEFKIDNVRPINKDHPFPIELSFCGTTYKLNKTKNNKLILTK